MRPYLSTFLWTVGWAALIGYVVVIDGLWQTVVGGLLLFIHIRAIDFATELKEAELKKEREMEREWN